MQHDYDFLIVGGGMVADAAAQAIREQGATGSIGIVGQEPTAPFPRPALSKKLWTDPEFTVDGAALETGAQTGAVLHLGVRATGVDPAARVVATDGEDTFGYGALLLATGGRPRRIAGLDPSERVLYYRSLTDYHQLRALAGGGAEIVVVGGSYIGTEIAAALSEQDCAVTLVFPQQVLGDAVFPAEVAARFQALFADAGVRLVGGARVEGGSQDGDRVTVRLAGGASLQADAVVVGLGIEPAGDLVDGVVERSADGGIVVDEQLRTSAEKVWAAGDVATYPDRILGRTRVEHVDNAGRMGGVAGRVMAGSDETYDHTPMFYSAVLGVRYEAVGTLDAAGLETVVDEHGATGPVVYYLDDDEVRGVLLWDVPEPQDPRLDQARALLARHHRPANPVDLLGAVSRG